MLHRSGAGTGRPYPLQAKFRGTGLVHETDAASGGAAGLTVQFPKKRQAFASLLHRSDEVIRNPVAPWRLPLAPERKQARRRRTRLEVYLYLVGGKGCAKLRSSVSGRENHEQRQSGPLPQVQGAQAIR